MGDRQQEMERARRKMGRESYMNMSEREILRKRERKEHFGKEERQGELGKSRDVKKGV